MYLTNSLAWNIFLPIGQEYPFLQLSENFISYTPDEDIRVDWQFFLAHRISIIRVFYLDWQFFSCTPWTDSSFLAHRISISVCFT